MRANPNLQFTVVKADDGSLRNFVEMLKQFFYNLVNGVINGHIGFGDGTLPDNVDGNWVNVTTPGAPNTDFTVAHNLGRLPVGYIPMQKDRAVDIYTGSIPATLTQITLRATVASALVRLFIVCLVLAVPIFGQSTSVTVNVTDSSGQVWIGGNYKIGFWTNPSFPNGYQWQDAPFNQTTVFTGTMDGSGNFTVSVPDNSTISPSGSAWKFTVCPLATFPCFDQVIGISGTTQNINMVPGPILISPTPLNSSYLNTQSKAGLGALMYKITDGHVYVCTASSPYRVDPSGSCSSWIALCEPGDGLCGGASTPITIQHNGVDVGTEPKVNLIDGSNITLTVADNPGSTRVDVTIAATGGGGGGITACQFGTTHAAGATWTIESAGVLLPHAFNNSGLWFGTSPGWIPVKSGGNTDLCSSLFLVEPGSTDNAPLMIAGNFNNRQVNYWGPNFGFHVSICHDLTAAGYPGLYPPDAGCVAGVGQYDSFYSTTWSNSDEVHGTLCADQLFPPAVYCSDGTNITTVGATGITFNGSAGIKPTPILFSAIVACNGGNEGRQVPVTDSTTNTWGATITGTGGNHVLAYCNGTNWTVAAK